MTAFRPLTRLAHALAVLLLAWQALAVQTHWHPEPARVSTVAGVHVAPTRHQPDQPADCPICREVTHAAAFLSSGAPVLVAPQTAALTPSARRLIALRFGARSLPWRSRAPPSAA